MSDTGLTDLDGLRRVAMPLSQLTLAINDPANCAAEVADNEDASVHYHDVDNPSHTTFVMASMWNAGLRVFDVRDPLQPTEVAYFNPGMYLTQPSDTPELDKAWGHVRYDEATGQIWFATQSGGFWVVELEPQVRSTLGLDEVPVLHPEGNVPRPVGTMSALSPVGSPAAASEQYYCTIGLAGV